MKTLIIAAILAGLAVPSKAEEAKKQSWSEYFKMLKTSLSQSAVSGERKKGKNAQGVAAVRGAGQDKGIADPNEPGLKGDAKSGRLKRDLAYDAELAAAVELVEKGKFDEGIKALETFQSAHPKHKAEDVAKALEGAKAMKAEKGGAAAE